MNACICVQLYCHHGNCYGDPTTLETTLEESDATLLEICRFQHSVCWIEGDPLVILFFFENTCVQQQRVRKCIDRTIMGIKFKASALRSSTCNFT